MGSHLHYTNYNMLSTVREKYLDYVLSFGRFRGEVSLKILRGSSHSGTLPPINWPNKIQTEASGLTLDEEASYRWKTLPQCGGMGSFCIYEKTVWWYRPGEGKHEPTVPVVTKEPTKELQVWHKTFDHKNPRRLARAA